MRCPKCSSVSSNKKDLCPKCRTDLRALKKKLGIPIHHPKLSYSALRAVELGEESSKSKMKKAEEANQPAVLNQPPQAQQPQKLAPQLVQAKIQQSQAPNPKQAAPQVTEPMQEIQYEEVSEKKSFFTSLLGKFKKTSGSVDDDAEVLDIKALPTEEEELFEIPELLTPGQNSTQPLPQLQQTNVGQIQSKPTQPIASHSQTLPAHPVTQNSSKLDQSTLQASTPSSATADKITPIIAQPSRIPPKPARTNTDELQKLVSQQPSTISLKPTQPVVSSQPGARLSAHPAAAVNTQAVQSDTHKIPPQQQRDQINNELIQTDSPVRHALEGALPSIASLEAVEFNDDLADLEKQLDALLGDEVVDIQAVREEESETSAQGEFCSLEVDFEGDDADEEEQEAAEEQAAVSEKDAAVAKVKNDRLELELRKLETMISRLGGSKDEVKELIEMVAGMYGMTVEEIESRLDQKEVAAEAAAAPAPGVILSAPVEVDLDVVVEEADEDSLENLDQELEAAIAAELKTTSAIDQAINLADGIEASFTNLPAFNPLSSLEATSDVALWARLTQDIQNFYQDEYEIAVHDTIGFTRHNDFDVLFALAEKEIRDPTTISRYMNAVTIADADKALDTVDLMSEFAKYSEQAIKADEDIEEMKKIGRAVFVAEEEESLALIESKPVERLAAFVVDFIASAALGIVLFWWSLVPLAVRQAIIDGDKVYTFEIYLVAPKLLAAIFVSWLVLTTLQLAANGATLGKKLFRLTVVTHHGYMLSFKEALLRTALQSTVFLTLGLTALTILQKKPALYDRLAETAVTKRQTEKK
ncbi:RDD family protein [bacterium]|nr:RDD family protein [bacterium]